MTLLGESTVTVTPYTGTYTNMEFVGSTGTPFDVVASVQPMGARELEMLDEATRYKAKFIMIVESSQPAIDLGGIDSTNPSSRVSWKGEDYLVHGDQNWQDHASGLPHNVYLLLKIGDDE